MKRSVFRTFNALSKEAIMFDSTVLDVVVGLAFTFLTLSLAVSAIVEAIASIINWRSRTLLQGIKDLLNDPALGGLALAIYNHALIDPCDRGTAQGRQDLKHLPAYIVPRQFADALIDLTKVAATAKESPDKLKLTIDANVRDEQINGLLKGIVDRTAGDLTKIRDEIAEWFDNAMDRVGGVYKRKTQLLSFVVALGLTVIFNVSALKVGKAFWKRPMIARTIAPQPNLAAVQAFEQFIDLDIPIGWTQADFKKLRSSFGVQIVLGWLITAVATLFGAPFWFDTLQQIIRLKGTGPSPEEKTYKSAAAI
jgi:hypothetical protein